MSQDLDDVQPSPHEPPAPEPTPPPAGRRPGPRLKIPVPPDLPLDDPEQHSPHRRLSTMVGINFLFLLILVLMLGFVIMEQRKAPGVAAASPDAAKPEEVKSVATEVDRLKAEIAGLSKKIGEMSSPADPTPQIKSLDEKVAELGKSVADVPARLESLGQKVDSATKGDGFAPAPRVEALDRRLGDLAASVEAIKAEVAARAAGATGAARPPRDINVEGQAMEQAADLFKQGKYPQAKDAFTKLQTTFPEDARVWYYSALANSLATRNWQGESERLARLGVEKEKAGSPDKARIDAVFTDLTAATGKDWLAFFRKQAAR